MAAALAMYKGEAPLLHGINQAILYLSGIGLRSKTSPDPPYLARQVGGRGETSRTFSDIYRRPCLIIRLAHQYSYSCLLRTEGLRAPHKSGHVASATHNVYSVSQIF